MNSTSFKYIGAVLLLGVALVFSCKVADAGATADDGTTDTGKTMHTVTIVLNNGTGVSDEPQKVEDGKMLTIGNPTKAGYVFKGWSTNNTLSNLDFTSGNYAIKSDITIYAMFDKLYTVTIDSNSGTVPTLTYQREDGASLTLTEIPQRTLYTFGGYKNGTTTYTLNTPFVVNGDMTLTAQWSVDLYAIRDMLTGGSTNGLSWNLTTGLDQYIEFKLVNASSLDLDVHIYNKANAQNTMRTTLEMGTNGNLAQFNPALFEALYWVNSNQVDRITAIQSNALTVLAQNGNPIDYTR